ncbi:hypothetical protein PRIPAC_74750 [Pristionchus pacificus]|uniref:Uncharacterized protein n=1 Tax=Pristionchus pacificus TaxID=54126 RepID=A0A2A6C806_PRIPA|nr:hypothetical protein PRIPAC_74750 [Pristionchus pacificus]|eukprot:PDM74237.1 hypothetical protein PRIPAC_41593 [Pristionchus pacificus]
MVKKRDILMSDLTKNETTLANLPPDIIRLLIQQGGVEKVNRLMVVSRTWNAMVQEYLADRSTHRPLADVIIDNGGPQWHRKDVRVTVQLKCVDDSLHLKCALRGWKDERTASLIIHFQLTPPDQITYFSPTLQLLTLNTENDSIKIIIFYSLIVLGVCFFKFRVAFYFLLIALGTTLLWLWLKVDKEVSTHRRGLSRLFSRCASIERLIICELDRNTLNAVRSTLADVPVNHLILEGQKSDGKLRNQLIKMARTNKIKKLSLVVQKFEEKELRKFFLDSTQSVDELNIYENTGNTARIFGKHLEFWKKAAAEMSDGSFSVQVMNGEPMSGMEDNYQWRFKVTY